MALITADRVFEATVTTGTADLVLAGALTGYRTFASVCANNDTCYYTLWEVDSAGLPTGAWETGLGTWVTGGTLQRTTVHASSTGSKLVLAAGTKRVALGLTATNAVTLAGSQTLTNKTISGASNTLTVDGSEPIGFRHIPQITKVADGAPTTGADLTYAGKHIYHTSTAGTFTIPANASVAYPIGTALTFVNGNGAGNLSIAITTDTMRLAGAGTTGTRTLAANGVATAIKVASTEWIISGTGLT